MLQNIQVARMEAKMIVTRLREILTVRDVALELRCSVAHVYNVINGKVKHVSRLPAIPMGRRKLIQRDTLEEWKKSNEQHDDDGAVHDQVSLSRCGDGPPVGGAQLEHS